MKRQWLHSSWNQLNWEPSKGKLVWGIEITADEQDVEDCLYRSHAQRAYKVATNLEATAEPEFQNKTCTDGYDDFTVKDTPDACHMYCACHDECNYVSVASNQAPTDVLEGVVFVCGGYVAVLSTLRRFSSTTLTDPIKCVNR